MTRLWPAALAVGLGIASLVIAPAAQACTTWSDGSICNGAGTAVLTILGFALITIGVGWWLYLFIRPNQT